MIKPRKEYVYVASRIDPEDGQNLGDFLVIRKLPVNAWGERHTRWYHYASEDYNGFQSIHRRGRIINRQDLRQLNRGSRIYNECIRAVDRLLEEERANER